MNHIKRIIIILLVLTDQIVKYLVSNDIGKTDKILPYLYYNPVYNSKGSYILSFIPVDIDIDIPYITFMYIIPLSFLFLLYRFLKLNGFHGSLFETSFILLFAGSISAAISMICWKDGCLDFIYIKGLFIFDIKDIFITVGAIVFLYFYFKNREKINMFTINDIVNSIKRRK